MLTQAQQNEIITAAIQAPSADNSQPFKFLWNNSQTLSLYIDKERSGKASDNRFVLSDIALGAVIENSIIKAAQLGLAHNIEYFPKKDDELFIAQITFVISEDTEPSEIALAAAIEQRSTDRRFPFKGPIPNKTIDKLSKSIDERASGVQWYTCSKAIKTVLPVIQKAESIRFKSQTLHQELFSTVHFNNPNSPEGMPIEVLAIEKPAQPMFKLMKKWSVMNFFNKLGAYALLGMRSVRIPILFSPALALITIQDNSRVSVIEGGRALQRFWLQATLEGLSIQPYAAPGIFSLGFVQCEDNLSNALLDVSKQMSGIVNGEHYGLMFFRIGFNKKVTEKTNRRLLDSFRYDLT